MVPRYTQLIIGRHLGVDQRGVLCAVSGRNVALCAVAHRRGKEGGILSVAGAARGFRPVADAHLRVASS